MTVADFAEVLKSPVDRLLHQLRQAGFEHKFPADAITDDQKLELLVYLRDRAGSASARRDALIRAGNRCSYPGCNLDLVSSSGDPIAEVCHIESFSRGGPRYSASRSAQERGVAAIENLIVLCPTHHRLVDSDVIAYPVEWLRKAKEDHERLVAASHQPPPDLSGLARRVTSFHESLELWQQNESNAKEEFWHQLFLDNPKLLAQAVPNCVIQIGNKCYVGGKGLSNKGGKVADFLYASKSTQNVVIVEIKTPKTPLMGVEYRSGVYSISEDLSGSIIQVLAYRHQLLTHLHSLKVSASTAEFQAFDPLCMVVAGNLQAEISAEAQRSSFDLFRASSRVLVITYDELFAKIRALTEMLDDDASIN